MTIFYQLNFIIQTMYVMINDGHVIEIEKKESKIFGVGASLKSLHTHLLLESYPYFKGYLSFYLSVYIFLL